ncbi:phosphotransferase family protein [Halalkalicoccus sp. NIPERK01]|uniref:phosphotransferase family protein n=1 Tax=Halalkalicoccus sp. NIPERK01 TaxID=3053469 RepID=UPI00256EDB1D|nr:phosphotransferase family protein [Halalkalicoccus sp. NIPERK01]MDL5361584.1 phosphotransferase family protein [Halalkalicoccus sp. NIPERK01]
MTDASETYFERLVDEGALADYLEGELGSVERYSVSHHQEGHSNETLFVTWGEQELVIRRPPPGEVAETAHDVLREYRVMDALQGTEVPLPDTLLACEDHDVMGSDFYVMERVEGDVLRESEPERFADHREAVGHELVDSLVAIHEVDLEGVGLGEFGRPAGYTDRQVERWGDQIEWATEVTSEEREVPTLEEVGDWLEANRPDSHPHTLVHGDYKLDNVMFAPGTPPELVAVFDWEMSTLGDPLADLGWMLSYWRDSKDPEPAIPELTARFMEQEGYPTRRELVERYEERSGIEFEDERFYRALAVYKLAALGEMFFRRYLEGNSDDPMYPKMRERVPALAQRAERIVEGDEPL